ncbi:hypothetical protein, partial [Klebsiella quasipneumoniae]|uniref:hypothetical protein n=1 Tax=Klebsiella quasipneumoniae TaxID=1463165 RepID=UPI002731B140
AVHLGVIEESEKEIVNFGHLLSERVFCRRRAGEHVFKRCGQVFAHQLSDVVPVAVKERLHNLIP